jgi:SAM-dependent methyltransferase
MGAKVAADITYQAQARSFGAVAAAYDAARPGYPEALFEAVEESAGLGLRGARVLDVGAGTGISTRLLAGRGARVVAVEPTAGMAERLHAVSPGIPLVRGDGNQLPFADAAADLVTYAQSFHWTDPLRAAREAHRVLRPGGALALWWNIRDSGEPWVAEHYARVRAACASYPLQTEFDRAEYRELPRLGFRIRRTEVCWERTISVRTALENLSSRSYVAVLPEEERARLLAAERAALEERFPGGELVEPYIVYLTVGVRKS